MSQLKAALADQTRMDEEMQEPLRRAKQQDYSALPNYLSSDWWRFLEQGKRGEEEKRLDLLCVHAGKLGLQHPTEETYVFLYLLTPTLHLQNAIFDCEKLKLLNKWKPVMKRHLMRAVSPPCRPLMLPQKWEECPEALLRAAYPDGFQPGLPTHKTLEEIIALGKGWPLRSTNMVALTGAPGLPSSVPSTELCCFFCTDLVYGFFYFWFVFFLVVFLCHTHLGMIQCCHSTRSPDTAMASRTLLFSCLFVCCLGCGFCVCLCFLFCL